MKRARTANSLSQLGMSGVFFAVLFLFGAAAHAETVESADKTQLLAAFAFNVGKFVHWTGRDDLKSSTSKVRIAVHQNSALRSLIEGLAKGKTLDGHEIEVVDFAPTDRSPAMAILVPAAGSLPTALLKSLKGCKCLIITSGKESDRFGATVNFYSDENHLRFAVDLDVAKGEGLELSSQLLKLGKLL